MTTSKPLIKLYNADLFFPATSKHHHSLATMEPSQDLNTIMPEIPDEFSDRAGLIVSNSDQPIDPIDQYVRYSDNLNHKATILIPPLTTNG